MWLPLHSACTMETIPPGLGPEPSYAIANVTLTKALSCAVMLILRHSRTLL